MTTITGAGAGTELEGPAGLAGAGGSGLVVAVGVTSSSVMISSVYWLVGPQAAPRFYI